MASELDERVLDEVEALQAILMDEVTVKTNESGMPVSVETVLLPATADDALQQYVRITLVVELPPGYPDTEPVVHLRNPRGLDDSVLTKIEEETKKKCEDYRGQPVIYELIELVKEHLTASNLPSCQCVICLYGFREGDHFTKTQCFHYFHSHCLACLVTTTEKNYHEEQEKLPAWQKQQSSSFQVLCPVCREPITYDMELLSSAPPPMDVENARQFELSDDLRSLQEQMASLFSYQKQRGGIIDPEAEESKLVLVTETQESEDTAGSSIPPQPLPRLAPVVPPGSRDWRRGQGMRSRAAFRGRRGSSRGKPPQQTATSR